MAEHVIETTALTKRYSRREGEGDIIAVDALDLRVRRGEVYGFLGPNGAGKTTVLRMLVGLIRPTSGAALVLGQPAGTREAMQRIGAMIESPSFYPYLSGRDNLRVMAGHANVAIARVDVVLDQVGLSGRGGDRFDTYSLGMKQRLGLAAALLKDPELLILDEPTNGLDPEGIAEMRVLIRQLGQGQRTVILSSHLMGEVEQSCDRIGIIRRGTLVAEGTVDELRGEPELRIRATPFERVWDIATELVGRDRVRRDGDALLLAVEPCLASEINRQLVLHDIDVWELTPTQPSLETIFLNLVHGDVGDSGEGAIHVDRVSVEHRGGVVALA